MGGRARSAADGVNKTDDRAVSPVIGKVLEAGLVVLYIGLLTTTLYGGVVPKYRTAVGDEMGQRVLSKSAERIQQAVPEAGTNVDVRTRVSLPETVRGRGYIIRADGTTLTLDHPNHRLNSSVRLALPSRVATVRGNWSSREPALITVRSGPDGLVVELKRGEKR
ncbi:hypothetical protein V5735_06820 (plasmid) [Haladaptatus sp. SPP-AMP-3]|uniref:DUF7266 family protein n=1 Tax=Haladaptatus sp. SPP-AMP-3 TaxID=3121295 RepID=UPI003C2CCE09